MGKLEHLDPTRSSEADSGSSLLLYSFSVDS